MVGARSRICVPVFLAFFECRNTIFLQERGNEQRKFWKLVNSLRIWIFALKVRSSYCFRTGFPSLSESRGQVLSPQHKIINLTELSRIPLSRLYISTYPVCPPSPSPSHLHCSAVCNTSKDDIGFSVGNEEREKVGTFINICENLNRTLCVADQMLK